MNQVTFITGNQNKADYLARHLGVELAHRSLDLDEIQSTDLEKIVTHKVKRAFALIKNPVIVDDVSLEFNALNGLPGPFIRYFVERSGMETCCRMLDGFKDRTATAICVMGYYDGKNLELFRGQLKGSISKTPIGERGFGWDKIFIPGGYNITRAQMNAEDDEKTYTTIKPFKQLKDFLSKLR